MPCITYELPSSEAVALATHLVYEKGFVNFSESYIYSDEDERQANESARETLARVIQNYWDSLDE